MKDNNGKITDEMAVRYLQRIERNETRLFGVIPWGSVFWMVVFAVAGWVVSISFICSMLKG